MKRLLLLTAALLLTAGLAGADQPAADFLTDTAAGDGGCVLPDLTGLSADEIEAAALEAGFDVAPVQAAVPACPVRFDCDSITNCAAGPLCSLADIGPCCEPSTGLQLCCITGTIKVRRCPCECTAPACALSCVDGTDVQWRCS